MRKSSSAIRSGRIAKGSKLKVSIERSAVPCSNCGFKGRLSVQCYHTIKDAFACPKCFSPLKIYKGNSLEGGVMECTKMHAT